ncbi:MAG: hypothetical protein JWO65_2119, partial [Sphingomonas bacterium]|nr:hypothetical protein [Sphingomonas bacterium]
MSMTLFRNALLTSTLLSATGFMFAAPANAQSSGGPASGTTNAPPALGVTNGLPGPGAAAGERSASGRIEDIIVTARRSNEKLQTTPVAVTALSNALLVQKQIVSVTDLARGTPA